MLSIDDIWFAAKSTRIVYMPPKLIETFGESMVDYTLVCEDQDNPAAVRVRTGLVVAERPRIITPGCYMQEHIENFSPEARRYFEEVMARNDSARIIQYGLRFRKENSSEQVVSGNVGDVAEQAARDAQDDLTHIHGVIIGSDYAGEVSLMYFITELVKRSLPHNARDFARNGFLGRNDGGSPVPLLRARVLSDMAQCNSREAAEELGRRLRDAGCFELFEDEFFELYRKFRPAH